MISKKAEYMLLILVDLAKQKGDGLTLSSEVAGRQGIPPKYIPQLIALLSRKGWITTVRGAGGGVTLAVPPESITVKDVVDLAQETFLVTLCLDPRTDCGKRGRCPLFPIWSRAQAELEELLVHATIAELVKNPGPL